MEITANLDLPYIMPSQAQKHVTHNEALRMLDALVQLSVESRSVAAPPGAPVDGTRYIVGADATGAWSGWDGDVACRVDGGWLRLSARAGWHAWVADEERMAVHDGDGWSLLRTDGAEGAFSMLGIGASPDATNRLAVKSDAVLLSHDDHTPGTGDIRVTLNKADATGDAALVLQNDWSSRAVIGLAGDDDLQFKVSADGSTFLEALRIESGDGRIAINGPGFAHSAINLKGKGLTGSGDGWFCFTVTNTNADATNKGGAVLTGAPYANSDKPFMVMGPWATSSEHRVYYGGGTWGCPSATHHWFLTSTYQPATDNTATLALIVDPTTVRAARNSVPHVDNTYSLGTGALRWSVVYSATGTINTSDARLKRDVAPVPLGLAFVRDLEPVSYRWKCGGHAIHTRMAPPPEDEPAGGPTAVDVPVPRPGSRTHYGLLAQQVKAALDAHGVDDFAGWTLADRDDPDSEQGLRYDEFVPVLIRAVQELAARLECLEQAASPAARQEATGRSVSPSTS